MMRPHRHGPTFAGFVLIVLVLSFVLLNNTNGQDILNASRFTAIESWAQLPDGRKWTTTDAIDIDSHGYIWVAVGCGPNTCDGDALPVIFAFDSEGHIVRSFGVGHFISPHGIHIDADDNIWVTDRGSHQVLRFRSDGKLTMALGMKGVAGETSNAFNAPSDVVVVVAANGQIFVADGHGGNSNARIVKFSKDGKFIKAWGRKGVSAGEFDTPHSLALDSRGRLFVADRANDRIQIFEQDGTYINSWHQFGRPSGLYIDKKDILYVTDSTATRRPNTGIRIGIVQAGTLLGFIPDPEKGTGGAEGIAADAMGNIYRPEASGRGLVKFVRR
jgi:sugar lactone lactonase YvrE